MILLIHHPPDRPHHTDLTGALAAANEQATDQEEREGVETAPHDGFAVRRLLLRFAFSFLSEIL